MAISKKAQILAAVFPESFITVKDAAAFLKEVERVTHTKGASPAAKYADQILKTHGVVYLKSKNGRARAFYANTGDTYTLSVLIQTAPVVSVRVISWGGWVEAQERRGNKFD